MYMCVSIYTKCWFFFRHGRRTLALDDDGFSVCVSLIEIPQKPRRRRKGIDTYVRLPSLCTRRSTSKMFHHSAGIVLVATILRPRPPRVHCSAAEPHLTAATVDMPRRRRLHGGGMAVAATTAVVDPDGQYRSACKSPCHPSPTTT